MPYMMQFSCGCLIERKDVKKIRGRETKYGDDRPIKYRCPTHPEAEFIKAFFRCEKCGKDDYQGIGGNEIKRHFSQQRRLCNACRKEERKAISLEFYKKNKDQILDANRSRRSGRKDKHSNDIDYRLRDKVITKNDCKWYLSKCLPDAAFDKSKPKYVCCNGCKRYAPTEANMIDHVKCSYDMICDNIYIFGDI